jgi:hypothetical protein
MRGTATVLLAAVLASCSGDDGGPDGEIDGGAGASAMDASIDGGDLGDAAAVDGGRDAAADGGRDASLADASEAGAACPREEVPLFHDDAEDFDWPATRLSLADFCDGRCPESLAAFDASFTCHDVIEDGGIEALQTDAGSDSGSFEGWTRAAGCGRVAYDAIAPSWPRHYNFDAVSGALIGAASLDDIFYMRAGCDDAAYVAGEIASTCVSESVQVCERR